MTDDGYLRLEGLAAYSSLSPRTLRDFTRDPHHPLPMHRVGRLLLFKRSEFDQWLREHDAQTPQTKPDRAYRLALAMRGHK